MTLEQVVEALKRCTQDPSVGSCAGCPYEDVGDTFAKCCLALLHDCLDLLKAQEPRVMTLEEVKDFNWDYCYLEEERLPGKEYRAVCGDYALTCITWPSVTSMRIQHGDESYGKEWRCWTSRPTDEPRKETPWQGGICSLGTGKK